MDYLPLRQRVHMIYVSSIFQRLAIVLGLAALLLLTGDLLSQIKPFRIQELLSENHPVRIQYENYKKSFNDETAAFIMIQRKGGSFTAQEMESISVSIRRELEKNNQLISISTPIDSRYVSYRDGQMSLFPFINEGAFDSIGLVKAEEPFYKNNIFNDRRDAFIISVDFLSEIDRKLEFKAVDHVIKVAEHFTGLWPGIEFYPLGTKVANYYFTHEMIINQRVITPLLLLLIGLFLYWTFRSFRIVALSFMIIVIAYAITLCAIISIEDGLGPYSAFALFFVLIVATSDLIHYFTKLSHAKENRCFWKVRQDLLAPCFLTSLTTAIGFSSLMFNENEPVRNFGLYCSIGTFVCFFLTFYFLPYFLQLFRWNLSAIKSSPFGLPGDRVWVFIQKRKRGILLFSFAFAALLVASSSRVKVDDNVYKKFLDSHIMSRAVDQYDQLFSFVGSIDLVITAKDGEIRSENRLKLMRDLEAEIAALPAVAYLKSYSQLMDSLTSEVRENHPSMPDSEIDQRGQSMFTTLDYFQAFGSLYSRESQSVRTVVFLNTLESQVLHQTIAEISKIASKRKYKQSFVAVPSGFSAIRDYVNTNVIHNFLQSFAVSFLIIFLIFSLLFRSFLWGCICMIPNVLPVLTIAGLMGLFNITMESNLVILVCVTLGLGVDDTIHFCYAFRRRFLQGGDFRSAVTAAVKKSSGALIGTTLIFVTSFPVFLLGNLKLYTQVGIFILLALVVALLADFLTLPSLLLISRKRLGKRYNLPTEMPKEKQLIT